MRSASAIQMVTAIFLCTEGCMLFVLLPRHVGLWGGWLVAAGVFCFWANLKSSEGGRLDSILPAGIKL
jgi:hypothetical protein